MKKMNETITEVSPVRMNTEAEVHKGSAEKHDGMYESNTINFNESGESTPMSVSKTKGEDFELTQEKAPNDFPSPKKLRPSKQHSKSYEKQSIQELIRKPQEDEYD